MRKWITSSVIGVVAAVVVAAPWALAATKPTPAPTPPAASTAPPGQGLEISPPVIELQANPGQTVTTNIRIRDVAAGELIAEGKADDFGASGETGEPKLLLNENGATRYSLKYWVASVPNLTLAPQELKTATITINVPANAEPGGHYGVIRFTAVPPNLQGTGVALSASIGALILMRVNGPITDQLSLVEFSASQNGHKGNFFEHGPVSFTVRTQNGGTVHEKPQGSIVVTDLFGKKVGTVAVNKTGGNVLPQSIRRFDEQLASKKLFGHYTAKLSLSYVGGVKTLSGTLGFWVIPWKLILLILIALILLFFLLRLALRKYNEHILNMARRQ